MAAEMRVGARLAAVVAGEATAVVSHRLVALLAMAPSKDLVLDVWNLVERHGTFDGLLATLGSGGFSDLPDLVAFGWFDDGVRLVIRGDVGVEVVDTKGVEIAQVLGEPLLSWSEHQYAGVGAVRAWIGKTRVADREFLGFAIDQGIVPARGLDVLAPATIGALGALPPPERERKAPAPAVARPEESEAEESEASEVTPEDSAASEVEVEPERTPIAPVPLIVSHETLVEPAAFGIGGDEPAPMPPGPAGATAPGPPAPSGPSAFAPVKEVRTPSGPPTDGGAFDHLFGDTQYASVEGAALRPSERDRGESEEEGSADLDHDGHTISAAELRNIIGEVAAAEGGIGTVGMLAVRCPADHLNPPHAASCRVCEASLDGRSPERVPAIELGVFRFSHGPELEVSGPMLIGRSPQVSGQVAGRVPDLVVVPSPAQDISRTHLEVRVEGWQVMVVDRGSTNGTVVTLPGRAPQRLRPDQPFPLSVGGSVSLAGECDFEFVGPK